MPRLTSRRYRPRPRTAGSKRGQLF